MAITENFPRKYRFTLGEKLIKIALELFEYIQLANMSIENRQRNMMGFTIKFEQLEHYVDSINSYLGYMRRCNGYAIRKRILLKMDRRFYRQLYIKGHYDVVCVKNRCKRRNIVMRKLRRDKRSFERLMENYYEEYTEPHPKGKGNKQMAERRKGSGDK